MDSAEETETIKRYNKNPFSFCIILLAVVVAFAGYSCLPPIFYLVQAIPVWVDWFSFVMRNVFVVVIVIVGLIFLQQHWTQSKTAEEKPDFYDQYVAARTSPEYNYRVTEVEDDYNNNNNSNFKEIVPAFQAVKECNCYGRRAVMEEVNSKSYRRTRSEKKAMRTVEYRSMESERVRKTASWRSETMDGLSSEEFRMTVETFITEKKKMLLWQNGGIDQRPNGVVQWQNNVPQLQNCGFDQRQNGVVQGLNNVPQLQNGAVDQWQNGVPQWQGSPEDGSGHHHRHRSRSQRLVGGSGSNGSGSYLAISN